MDDFFSLLLWSCLGLLALAIFIWVFVLQKSLRRLILAFIGALLGRDNRVDPDAPIQTAPPGTRVSEILQARAREAQQQPLGAEPLPVASADPLAPPSVPPPLMPTPAEPENPYETTSASGWPARLDPETSGQRRPFLHTRLNGSKDDEDSEREDR